MSTTLRPETAWRSIAPAPAAPRTSRAGGSTVFDIVHRTDDAMIDALAADGIAEVARDLGQTPQAVALARLLRRGANILVIPGTSKRPRLRADIAAAGLRLDPRRLARLDALRRAGRGGTRTIDGALRASRRGPSGSSGG